MFGQIIPRLAKTKREKMDNLAKQNWCLAKDKNRFLAKSLGYIVIGQFQKHDIGNEQDNYCGK